MTTKKLTPEALAAAREIVQVRSDLNAALERIQREAQDAIMDQQRQAMEKTQQLWEALMVAQGLPESERAGWLLDTTYLLDHGVAFLQPQNPTPSQSPIQDWLSNLPPNGAPLQ